MSTSNDPEERLREATAHLQAAAKELIAAARVALDAAEELIDDPGPLLGAMAALADLGRSVISPRSGADEDADQGLRPQPRVQHVKVS